VKEGRCGRLRVSGYMFICSVYYGNLHIVQAMAETLKALWHYLARRVTRADSVAVEGAVAV